MKIKKNLFFTPNTTYVERLDKTTKIGSRRTLEHIKLLLSLFICK